MIEPEIYMLFHLFPTPVVDDKTVLHHVILSNQKDIETMTICYTLLFKISNIFAMICKDVTFHNKICPEALLLPIGTNDIFEALLLSYTLQIPKVCQITIIFASHSEFVSRVIYKNF